MKLRRPFKRRQTQGKHGVPLAVWGSADRQHKDFTCLEYWARHGTGVV